MIAYKFLKNGAIGLVSGFRWPTPDGDAPAQWVDGDRPLQPCVSGIHACRAADLPYWMHDELWAIEVEGDLVDDVDMVVAPRGRLLRRFDAWSRTGRRRFVEACRDRAADVIAGTPQERRHHADAFMSHMDKYLRYERTQLGALCTALAIASTARDGERDPAPVRALYRSERAWQAKWLIEELDLHL